LKGDRVRPKTAGALGRYSLHETIAHGDEASVHLGLLDGASGFRKPVAIKRLLPCFVRDRAANARLANEARVLAQIQQSNVIQVLDLVEATGESFLVTEYVLGETVAGLMKTGRPGSIALVVAVLCDVLRGLDAAHAARGAAGEPLFLVHRNVRPENILVGADGLTRVLDFGSALSRSDSATLIGGGPRNLEYAAPEQLEGRAVDRRADIFSVGVVLWEMLSGKRLFRAEGSREAFAKRSTRYVIPASAFNVEVPRALDTVVLHALSLRPEERFDTAGELAAELEAVVRPATASDVAAFVEQKAKATLKTQRSMLAAIDAPLGRISEPPDTTSGRFYDDATVRFTPDNLLLRLSLPRRLRGDGSSRRFSRPGGSIVLASSILALLLLVGVKLSRGTTSAVAAPPAAPQAAFEPRIRVEPERAPAERPRPAPRIAAAVPDVAPAAEPVATVLPEAARPANVSQPVDESARPSRRAPERRTPSPSSASCSPPFTFDASGIRRLKVHCL